MRNVLRHAVSRWRKAGHKTQMAWVKGILFITVITVLTTLSQCVYAMSEGVEMRFGDLFTQEIMLVQWWDDMETCIKVREVMLSEAVMIAEPNYFVTCTPMENL